MQHSEQHSNRRLWRRIAAALFVVCVLLYGCKASKDDTAPTVPVVQPLPQLETELNFMGEPMPDLHALAEKKHLKSIDLRGHAVEIEDIEALQKALPDCEILYSLSLGGNTYACTAETLRIETLTEEDIPLLSHFPNLMTIDARGSDCGAALKAYAAEHPEQTVLWSVPIGSVMVDHNAVWVDLSLAELPDTETLIQKIKELESATDITLVGCDLSRADKALLLETFPDLRLYWTVEISGKQFKNTETRLDFNTVNFNGMEDLASAVACFQDPQWVDVATHGFESEEMVQLSERFPNTEFVWTVRIGGHTVRTDIEVFYGRSGGGDRLLRNEDLQAIQYCKNLRAVNLYRNSLSDLSPLAALPKLEVLVISHNKLKSLSDLSGLQNLKYLEAHNNHIQDISALSGLTELRDVNLMFNDIQDFSPLMQLEKLQRGYLSRNEGLEDGAWKNELNAALKKAELDFDDSNTRGWQNHDRYDLLDRIWTSTHMEELY